MKRVIILSAPADLVLLRNMQRAESLLDQIQEGSACPVGGFQITSFVARYLSAFLVKLTVSTNDYLHLVYEYLMLKKKGFSFMYCSSLAVLPACVLESSRTPKSSTCKL